MKDRPFWSPEEFLNSGECPYGRSTLYRLLGNGTIPAIRHGRNFVIPKTAWRRYLDTCGQAFNQPAA
jgi:excisionase family DNA binding protein